MKIPKMSLIALAAAGLLSLAPALQAQVATNPPPARRNFGRLPVEEQLKIWSDQLQLTEDQKPKVKAALEDNRKAMQDLRNLSPDDRRAKLQSIREDLTKKMKEILTAEQFKKYQEIQPQPGQRGHRPPSQSATNAPAANSKD